MNFVNNVVTLGRVPSRGSLVNVYSRVHVTIIPSLYEVVEKIRGYV
jgi:hypothetical protein